jgi:molecular chaperone DnaJ
VAAAGQDYYELLGVPRDADEETIRRAFHAAARTWHPDVSASPDADRHFRQLAEAYDVLTKPSSRLLYDRYGYRGRGNSGFDEVLWDSRDRTRRGETVNAEVELRSFEAEGGARKLVEYETLSACATCEGRGTANEPDPTCRECRGSGYRRRVAESDEARIIRLEPCPACAGDQCAECLGVGRVRASRRLRVRIPPGVEDGAQLRIAGEGGVAPAGGIPGDLLVSVSVLPEPRDVPLVRYAALALFTAALAALLAYLLL